MDLNKILDQLTTKKITIGSTEIPLWVLVLAGALLLGIMIFTGDAGTQNPFDGTGINGDA